MPFVVNGNFGVYTGLSPKKIASSVHAWFNDEKKLQLMSKNAVELSHPSATKDIAKDLGLIALRKEASLPTLERQ